MFLRMFRSDAAQPTRQHDGFVVTAHFSIDVFFEGTEVSGQIRAAEFVVKSRAADGAVNHDLQGGSDAGGLAVGRTLSPSASPTSGRGE